ncbi:WD repeat-containing protein 18 [Notothenia coriiceps]|uniref:WD repeat-containing protein 18 n=1 Tax=Notothenia coriiceps TaxID=8208 RepID=A0A6I9Q5Z3_9TELE|nr:PREDICTED: WD repeat-containing protein 18 [Notothenia coriiceps]
MVTCLSVSMDGTLLLSGSHDETVRLWDIQSKQSIRSLAHKGPVTNAVIMAAPANMFLPDSRPAVPLPRFSRHLQASEGGGASEVCVRPALYTQEEELTYMQKADMLNLLMNAVTDKSVYGDGENTKVRVSELEEEVQTLKKVNKDLYEFTSQLLTKPT